MSNQSNQHNKLETIILRSSFVLFLVLHLAFLLLLPLFSPVTKHPEISIDIDLLPESAMTEHATLTPSKPPPVDMLPQLPKKFKLQQPQPLAIDPEPAPDEPKPEPSTDNKPPPETLAKTVTNEDNTLRMHEALQRLALEKLRVQQQQESKRHAAISKKMHKVISNISTLQSSNTIVASYKAALRLAIKRNFILPDIYDLRNANIEIKLKIKIDARGNLMRMLVLKPSRNKVFDDLAIAAVRNTSPFPIPPAELVDQEIIVILTPLMTS